MFDAIGIGAALGGALASRPGAVIPVRSQQDLQNYAHRQQQCEATYMQLQMQSQKIGLEAQLAAQLMGQSVFASAALAASSCTVRKRTSFYPTRERHRRRNWMRTTKAGYKARERAECALWISVGTILLGGVVLPLGLRAFTSLWTWALGGG